MRNDELPGHLISCEHWAMAFTPFLRNHNMKLCFRAFDVPVILTVFFNSAIHAER